MSVYLLSGVIFLLAGLIQGLTGFGAGLVAIPLLCLIMGVKLAVPLCILNGLVINTTLAYAYRHLFDWRRILPLLLGSIPGIVVGTLLFKHADPLVIKKLLGILLLSYSGFNLLFKPRAINPPLFFAYAAGFLSGASTATLSAGGPPVIIYATLTDWKKNEIKATLIGFFVLNGYLAAATHAINGAITMDTLLFFAVTTPFVLAGTFIGLRIGKRVNRRLYLQTVYLLLMGLGALMVIG